MSPVTVCPSPGKTCLAREIFMTVLRALLVCLVTLLTSYPTMPQAMADDLKDAINALAEGSLKDREIKVDALLQTGDDKVVPVLTYLAEGDLYFRKSDKKVFLADKAGRTYRLTDPISGDVIPDISKRDIKKVRVNNSLRRQIRDGLSLFALNSQDPAKRLQAAETIYKAQDASALPAIEARLEKEQDEQVIAFLQEARAGLTLTSDASEEAKLSAIAILREKGGRQALSILTETAKTSDGNVKEAASRAVVAIERMLAIWNGIQNVWYGLSLVRFALGIHRPCHHLRRDGRHQHGPWGNGHDRRLYHIHRAAGDPDDGAWPA